MLTRTIPCDGVALPAIGCGTWLGFDIGQRPQERPARAAVPHPLHGHTHYDESAYPDLEQAMKAAPWDFVQFNYSVTQRRAAERLLPLAAQRGMAVLVNLPFGGGKLLKTLRARPLPGWAAEIGCSAWSQVLLKFVLAQPAVTCVIPGTSQPEHMRPNALAGEGAIPGPQFWTPDKLAAV